MHPRGDTVQLQRMVCNPHKPPRYVVRGLAQSREALERLAIEGRYG